MSKGKNAGNQHFLLFQQCFLPVPERTPVVKLHLLCGLQMLRVWTSLKNRRLVKQLIMDAEQGKIDCS